jgi:hypothetical protein
MYHYTDLQDQPRPRRALMEQFEEVTGPVLKRKPGVELDS